MARKDTTEELLRYTFTPDEKQDMSDKLALACQDRFTAEEEKKSAMAGFKKRVDDESARISHFSRLVNSGWEMRPTECRVEYHTPVNGTKRITRIDTGELVRELAMTAAEFQETLTFNDDAIIKARENEKAEHEKLEASVREFFKAPEAPSPEPIDVSEITSFRAGGFLLAATDENAAKAYVAEHAFIKGEVEWCDPDATTFSGLEETYGDEARSARAAIMRMFEMGRSFPCILAFPPDVAVEPGGPVTEGEKPTGEGDANDGQPPADEKKPRRGRKPKGEPEAPAPEEPNPLEPTEE